MDRWSQLSMSEKSDLMSLYIRNGISSLEEIKKHYNSYRDGGRVDNNPDKDPVLKDRKPKANFYQRLLNPFRQTIPNWENRINGENDVATHKLSWATDDNGNAIVYPKVQEINGKLYDFTDPRNKAGKWDALDRAIETGDTIQMTPEQANFWTQHYKEFYPSFKFATGGHLYQDGGPDDDIAFTRTLAPVNIVEDAPEGVQIARRMLSYDKPYRNFMKAQDMDLYHRVKSTIFPIDCVNTATRAITQDSTIGANRSLFDNPEKYGYVRVDPDSIHAGDLVQYVTYNGNWRPYHAGIVVKVPDEGVEIKSANGSGEMNPKRIYDNRVYPNAYDTLMYYRYIGNKK